MPNLENQFKKFLIDISLTETKRTDLLKSGESNRGIIKKYFGDILNTEIPVFYLQGSFVMGTTINPLPDGEYDLDDGLYLKCLSKNKDDWETPSTVHGWICDSLTGVTSENPNDKNTCVRLVYKKNYHIDFPIYAEFGNEQYLAHKTEGWIPSYPKIFTSWFNHKSNENPQLKNLVMYLKAWKDYNQDGNKLPSGMVLSILIVNNYIADDEDQHAFLESCRKILRNLKSDFSLNRPIEPYENLLNNYSETRKNNFLNILESLIKKGDDANNSESEEEASKYWKEVFGDRFPLAEAPKKFSVPVIIGSNGKSA